MRSLADIRKALGGAPDYTDEQLVNLVHQVYKPYYPDFNEFASKVGYDPGDDFGRGLRIGGQGVKGAFAGAGALAAGALGADELQQSAFDVQAQAGQEAHRLGRTYDDPAQSWRNPTGFLAGAAGQVLPSAGVALGSYATGGVLGGVLGLGARGATALGAGTSFGTNLLMESGDIYGMQHEQGIDKPAQALGYGAAAAALDTGSELLGIGRLARGTRGGLRGARNAALQQAAVESGTEVAQTGLERLGADLPLTDDTSAEGYRRAAALGAIGGGMFGAVTGLRKTPGLPVDVEPDLLKRGEFGADDVPAAPEAGGPPPRIEPVLLEDALPVALEGAPPVVEPLVPLAPVEEEPAPPTVQDDVKARIAQRQQEIDAAGARATEFGLKGPKQVELFEELEKLRAEEAISQDEFEEQLVDLGVNKLGQVRNFVKRILNAVEGQKTVEAKQAAAAGGGNVGVVVPAGVVPPESGGQRSVDAAGSVADPGRVLAENAGPGAGVTATPGGDRAAAVPVRSADSEQPAVIRERYKQFDGVQVSQKFTIAETGEEAEVRRDAGKTLRDLDFRESALHALKACLAGK